MIPVAMALTAAVGVFVTYSALRPGTSVAISRRRARGIEVETWLRQAGLERVDRREFAAAVGMLFVLSTSAGYAMFGGLVPAIAIGAFGSSFPFAIYRR